MKNWAVVCDKYNKYFLDVIFFVKKTACCENRQKKKLLVFFIYTKSIAKI
jgi:hypothetical protein